MSPSFIAETGARLGEAASAAFQPPFPRRSLPWRFPDDMPWNAALHLAVTPVLLTGSACLKLGCAAMESAGTADQNASSLLGLFLRCRALELEPLIVTDRLPEADDASGRASFARRALNLGKRLLLFPPAKSLWSVLSSVCQTPVLLFSEEGRNARRSGLLLLLAEAARRGNSAIGPFTDCLRACPGGKYGWPCLIGRKTLDALAGGRLDWKKDLAGGKGLPAYDNADARCAASASEIDADARSQTWLGWNEALRLLEIMGVPGKGVRHGAAVGQVARALAEHGRLAGKKVNPELAAASGLVHDIAKGSRRHEMVGGIWLDSLGLAAMARCIRDHRDLILPADSPVTERELVYLADKYCFGPRFVPLTERFGQKMALYASQPGAVEGITRRLGHARDLERRLTEELGLSPELIARRALTERTS